MKRVLFAVTLFLLFISCAPTPSASPLPTPSATAASASTLKFALATATIAAMPTGTPPPTSTSTPEVIPLRLNNEVFLRNYNVTDNIFNRAQVFYKNGDTFIGNNGGNWGSETVMVRLLSNPSFDGPVVHVQVSSRDPKEGMQRPYVTYEKADQSDGEWAYEASYIVSKAPKNLKDSGWHGDPIVVLQSLLTHIDRSPRGLYRLYGGVRLYYDSVDGKYYLRAYTGNAPSSGPAISDIRGNRVEFELGVKQGVRTEIFYNKGVQSIRSFLIKYDPEGKKTYNLIGQGPLTDEGLKSIPIRGSIVWEGIYPSNSVNGLEAIVGEGRIFKK